MKPAPIDTDILSLFLRNHPKVKQRFEKYLLEHGLINISIITYYEIISGLKYKNAAKQLRVFKEFVKYSSILLAAEETMNISADIYAELRKKGELIDDIDILIAGIAISNDLILITHNRSHFDRIS